jgi:hypothetical protein
MILTTGAASPMRVSTLIPVRAVVAAAWMLVAACGSRAPSGPVPTSETLLTYRSAVAYLPPGIAEYKAAIVFLPGLRDPSTGKSLDSRALVRGTADGACSIWCPASAAVGVPGYFLIGAQDAPYRRDNITAVFEAGRAGGAPWAVSIDPYGHGPMLDLDLMFGWIDAVLAARLRATAGAPLRAMTETNGWLGARSSGAIATFACYAATPSSASWLPTRETALGWQRMAGGTVVTSAC